MAKEIEIKGTYDPRFEPVAELMRKQLRHYGGGAAAAAFVDGEPVLDIWAGPSRSDGTPWQRDTMSIGYSGTMGLAAPAIQMLASEGLID